MDWFWTWVVHSTIHGTLDDWKQLRIIKIHFRRLLFQAGERENVSWTIKTSTPKTKKHTKTITVLPRPKKETTESKELNSKDKKEKKENVATQPRRAEKRRTSNIERQVTG